MLKPHSEIKNGILLQKSKGIPFSFGKNSLYLAIWTNNVHIMAYNKKCEDEMPQERRFLRIE